MKSHWKNDLQQAAKLRTYRLCKRERQTENYLRVSETQSATEVNALST